MHLSVRHDSQGAAGKQNKISSFDWLQVSPVSKTPTINSSKFFSHLLRTLTAALSPRVVKLTNTAIASLTDVAVAAILAYCPSENWLAHRPLELWCHCLSICTGSNKFYLTGIEQWCNYEHVCPAISLLHWGGEFTNILFFEIIAFFIFSFITEWYNPL